MTELILTGVIAAILIYMSWDRYLTNKERSKLINSVIAKNAVEAKDLDVADKGEPPQVVPPVDPYMDMSQLDDDRFKKVLEEEMNARNDIPRA